MIRKGYTKRKPALFPLLMAVYGLVLFWGLMSYYKLETPPDRSKVLLQELVIQPLREIDYER